MHKRVTGYFLLFFMITQVVADKSSMKSWCLFFSYSLTFAMKVFRCCMCCLGKGALRLFLFPSVYFEQTGERRLLLSLTKAKFSASRFLSSCQSRQRHILSSNVSLNRSSIMLLLFLFTIIFIRLGQRAVAGEDDGGEEEEERKKSSQTRRNSEKKSASIVSKEELFFWFGMYEQSQHHA